MKKLVFLAVCLFSFGASNRLWGWPPGLRPSSETYWGNTGSDYQISSFGDSVASGYNSGFKLIKVKGGTYADHYGRTFNSVTNRTVRVKDQAWAGYTMDQIFSAMLKGSSPSIAQNGDLIFLEGGGNDFLGLVDQKIIDLCNPETFYPALKNAEANYISIMDNILQNKKDSAAVKVLGMYYPLVHETRVRPCVLTKSAMAPSVHLSFLKILSLFNWFAKQEAEKRGFTYVDVFAHMNCAEKDWASCEISGTSDSDDYHDRLLAIDQSGILQDPFDLGWIQDDHIHPNTNGHELIAWTIKNAD